MVSHIWSILKQRDSLWVQWIHSYRLRGRNFWNCKETTTCSWSWRKILQLRPLVKEHIWSSLGAGTTISAWYDSWCHLGPLSNILSPRVITNAGFRIDAMVTDVYRGDAWAWPNIWRDLFPVLNQLDHVRPDHNKRDRLLWKDGDNLLDHSSFTVWDSLRIREQEVNWVSIVWFPQCIPRHAFLVWNSVRAKADMGDVDPKWSSIVNCLMTRRRVKSASSYVARLLVGATAYIIWQERNARLFKNQTRPPEAICEVILKIVRYKLMGVKFKSCATVKCLLGKWGIDEDAIEDNGG
ncbi:uncharacterized protein LOC110875966 [Helianthus annuus]|uniref:uncharacterized protein LOC110875966 n=1 Tax=Helianthus annuus TaxID=4232 RepID=UPI000B8F69F5|nr:uncharacterized protein LOC110875966 [Helianthus annuus]